MVETAKTLLDIADEGLAALVAKRVSSFLPPDKAAEFLKLRKEAAWGPREMELFERSLTEIVKKYDWASRYGPEIMLGLLFAQYGIRQARVFASLSRLEADFVQHRARGGAAVKVDPAQGATPAAVTVKPAAPSGSEKFPGPGDVVPPGAPGEAKP